jgi:hypothetical protein
LEVSKYLGKKIKRRVCLEIIMECLIMEVLVWDISLKKGKE